MENSVPHARDGGASVTGGVSGAKLIAVLEGLIRAGGEAGITELSEDVGLPKSVVHRGLTLLQAGGYVTQTEVSRRYILGPQAIVLGQVALGRQNVRTIVMPHLEQLVAETGESATLSLLAGEQRHYAEQVQSPQPVRQTVDIGRPIPLWLGASGKAILAFLGPERERIIGAVSSEDLRRPDGRPVTRSELLEDLQEVRTRGYATSFEERVRGATSAAAPIFDHTNTAIGSISVAGVAARNTQSDLVRFGRLALDHAIQVSLELGYRRQAGESGFGALADPTQTYPPGARE